MESYQKLAVGMLALALGLAVIRPVRADEPAAPASERPVSSHPGDSFYRGYKEFDLNAAAGFRLKWSTFNNRTDAPFAALIPRYGKFDTSRREYLYELPIAIFYKPEVRYATGPSFLVRQHFSRRRAFAPYVELGAGAMLTDLRIHEVGGEFQFLLSAGAGFRVAASDDTTLTLGARYYHLSNAGIRSPNTGLNNGMVMLGVARAF